MRDEVETETLYILSWVWQELEHQMDVCKLNFTNKTGIIHSFSLISYFIAVFRANCYKIAKLEIHTINL
jgi:hypothetical protein